MKRIWILLLAALLCLSMAGCGGDGDEVLVPTESEETETAAQDLGELVILFTGGLENEYARDEALGTVGYGALAAYADVLKDENTNVILIDGGASVAANGPDGLWEIVDACGFDLRVPGEEELSTGVRTLTDRAEELKDCTYISCNLLDSGGNSVFEPYALVEAGDVKVGFVGVTQPNALEEDGYSLLGADDGQLLYDAVQGAIDAAADAGAEYVVVVGNLGTAPEDSPWTTAEVIANITGLSAWLDCGSGAVLDGDVVADKDDFEIPLCAPGSGFRYVGLVRLDLNDGSASVELLTEFTEEDRTVINLIQDLNDDE